MAPTILVVGATGNTGKGVMEALPGLLKQNKAFSQHRVLALTRTKDSPGAQKLASLEGVELAEQNWIEITADWLREHEVVRAFIASHNEPTQFAEEGQFLVEALQAGVEYVVRISTTAANVVPNLATYYPRTHWAIEQMLSQSEFSALHWTSLQPNVFHAFTMGPAIEYIKKHRKTGKPSQLSLIMDAKAPVGVVEAAEVGVLAAHLLTRNDTTAYNKKRLVVNGPEDVTGEDIVKLVEAYTGEEVKDVKYRDMSFIHAWADSTSSGSKNVIRSVTHAQETAWKEKCKASTTSREVLDLAPPKITAKQSLAQMLES